VESVKDIWGDAPPIAQAARATGELAGKTFNNAVESTIRKDLPKKIADPFADATSAITKALEDAARAQDRFIADLESRAARVFASTRTEQERYNQTVAELDQLLNAGVITLDTYTRGLVQAQEALERSSKSADVFTESVEKTEKQVNQFAQQGADRAFDIFADAFFNPMEKGFSGILDSFAKMLQDMALAALKQQVLQAFFGAATGGGAVAAGGGPVGAVASIGSAIAGGLSTRGSALEYHDAGMGSARSGVSTRAQAMTNDVNVTNVNVIDPSMVQQMLMTPDGQRAVLNVIRANRQVIL
jgi:cell division septum initiation protein DivIVA